MRCALLVGLLVAASAPVASAGTYLGLAVGPAPAVDSSSDGVAPASRTGRLLGGFRFGHLSVEGTVTSNDITWPRMGALDYSNRQLAVAGKYNVPLSDGFEAFGKLGLAHNWVSGDGDSWDGSGWLLGAGIEYNLKLPIAPVTVFVGYEYSKVSFTKNDWDLSSRQWMLGATVGL